MSLVYWLPMVDGTLKNQGLSDVAVAVNNGATVNSSGKLGKCFDFAGSTSSYIDTRYKEELGTGDFTLSAWFKLTDSGSRTYQPIISNKTTAAASVGCAIYYNHTNGRFLWSTADGTNYSEVWGNSNASAYSTILNGWHHISMIRNSSDPKIGYFYLDGERIDLAAVPAIRNVTNTAGNMLVGRIHTSNVNYTWTGSLCDIRIYDHALSAREAKELSKGLVLHYPLNREGFGKDNICKDRDIYLSGSDYGAYNTRSYDEDTHIGKIQVIDTNHVWNAWRFGSTDLDTTCVELTTGVNTYTISVDVKVTNYTTGTISCGFDFRTGGTVSKRATAVLTKEQCDGSWHRISATLTTNDEKNSQCLWSIGSSSTVHGSQTTIEYKNWKLERGDVATPWVPNRLDDLYHAMGLDETTTNLLPANRQNFDCQNNDAMSYTYTTSQHGTYTLSGYLTRSTSNGNWVSPRITIYARYSSGSDTVVSDYDHLVADGKERYFELSVTTDSSRTLTSIGGWILDHSSGTSGSKNTIGRHIQLEFKDHATLYTPTSRDFIFYDVSGYGYNGTAIGVFTYSGDTPRYQVSTVFNGTDNGILIKDLPLSNVINTAVTYSFWIKPDGENGGRSVYFGSYNGTSWSIEKSSGNVLRGYWNGNPDVGYYGATIVDDTWQHICITKNGTSDIKVYINGSLKATSTAAHNALTFPTTYRIGRDVRSGDGTPYKGLMSDFRIYATALSAEDVLDLYQTSASLTSNGVLMASEFVES